MSAGTFLLVRTGTSVCAIPLASVGETMRPLAAESLPGMPPFVRGIAIVRGEPTPVIDARAMLGLDASAMAQRFVTLLLGARRAMLAVDSVVGVRVVDIATLGALAPIIGTMAGEVIDAVGRLDEALLYVLRATVLVPESVWPAMEAHRR